jgi:hypothetical protein
MSSPHDQGGCHINDPRVTASPKPDNTNINFRQGGHQWYWASTVTFSEPGDYTFDCREGGNVVRYALGDKPNFGAVFGGIFGGVGAIALGSITGLVIIIVTAIRRSSARRRLPRPMPG